MKVGLIQFSDIHFQESDGWLIDDNVRLIYNAIKNQINETSKVIIIITGDLSWSGQKEEFDWLSKFLSELRNLIKVESRILSVEYILVPGNHDCDFSKEDDIRECIIKSQNKADDIKSSLIEHCLSPQNQFWDFYSKLINKEIKPFVSNEIKINLTVTKSLYFHCYNTSMYSELNEKVGSLIIPESYLLKKSKTAKKEDIVISLYHHCTGWLSPNTTKNNKRLFENHIFKTSNIIMCGHEHESNRQVKTSLESGEELIYLESSAFNYNNKSEFGLLIYETDDNKIIMTNYKSINNSYYIPDEPITKYIKTKTEGISLQDSYKESLNNINIPISHPQIKKLRLQDIFIYPDLEPLKYIKDKTEKLLDSSVIVNNISSSSVIIIDGEEQSGKTSLFNMYYLQLYNNGYYPLLLNGNDISNININDITKRNYKEQYNYKDFSYNNYMQLDNNKRILFIDDFHLCELNKEGIKKIIEKACSSFSCVLLSSKGSNEIRDILLTYNKDSKYKRYRIVPLGYVKRNELIEKWLKLGIDPYSYSENTLSNDIKLTFDQITNLLGEQLIPSYPVFILTLLQGLNHNLQTFDITQTSYAYCYQTLIIASLFRANVNHDNINSIINYVTELSYEIYDNRNTKNYITNDKFIEFHKKYEDKFPISYLYENIVNTLKEAYLIEEKDEGYYYFKYKYIYYFLVAKKIASLNKEKRTPIIRNLCSELYEEENANILIFITHHSGDNDLIYELLCTCLYPFSNYTPITLDQNDSLFSFLSTFVTEIRNDILISDIDPKMNRKQDLERKDEIHRNLSKNGNDDQKLSDENDISSDKDIIEFAHTQRIIKIIGQIIKNQKGNFEKDKLNSLLKESYFVCFRSLGFFRDKLIENKSEIIEFFHEEIKKKGITNIDENELDKRINTFLMLLLYITCIKSFDNLSLSVGTSKMGSIYDKVANEINSPAANLVSFIIKTYYGSLKITELEELYNSFSNNQVAKTILENIVRYYVYNNPTDYSMKQKIGQICNLKLINNSEYIRQKDKSSFYK
ncbi:metallophosphoesterase [Phocaeicola paurosaccharolyticus]|uniref:metallophosphoesterase family protein n=1 Tax=Phocaeicola paurosaccharolyticus TaxID=732242 RepID=UPI002FE37BF5